MEVTESRKMTGIAAYYRVSTKEQGKSGLGLDAQRAAVIAFAKAEGLEITQEFTEIETGKGADALERRPQLAAALRLRSATRHLSSSQSWIGSRAMFTSSSGLMA